jgi:transcriptional regulator
VAFKSDLEALVLGVLQTGDLHGYEIAKRIQQISERALQVGEGQLYPALHKLEKQGLVCATWVPQEGKPPRKVYSLTDAGLDELSRQRRSWEAFANAVNAVLLPKPTSAEGSRG